MTIEQYIQKLEVVVKIVARMRKNRVPEYRADYYKMVDEALEALWSDRALAEVGKA